MFAIPATFDVAIIGAGPAGSSAALTLARAGWRVGLFDRRPRAGARTGETLPSASRSTLRALGVWSRFVADGHAPSPGTVSWWASSTPAQRDSVFDPCGPAWHVDRARFDRMLVDAAIAAGAHAIRDARLVGAQPIGDPAEDGWRLTVATPTLARQTCTARVLIVATGRANPIPILRTARRRLDRLIGIGLVLSGKASIERVDRRIWIEATAAGWWYSAPMPDGQWTTTFFTDADHAAAREGRSVLGQYWLMQLSRARHTAQRLASLGVRDESLSPGALTRSLQVIAADSYRRVPCQGPGWIAAGDAAAAWDPLCGQGIEKALTSAVRAAHAADLLLRAPDDRASVLDEYARHEQEQDRLYRERYYAYYSQVQRWPEALFWQRRAARVDGDQ